MIQSPYDSILQHRSNRFFQLDSSLSFWQSKSVFQNVRW